MRVSRIVLWVVLLISVRPVPAAERAVGVDDQIAAVTAIMATNRLAENIEDETGLLLFHAAAAMAPEVDRVLLLRGLLKRQLAPDKVETPITEAQLAAVMSSRADALMATIYPHETRVGRRCALYYAVALRLTPYAKAPIIGLARLELDMEETDPAKLTDRATLVPVAALGKPHPPARRQLTAERELAEGAARLATNRLAADPIDDDGLVLLAFAQRLDRENRQMLLVRGSLSRGLKLDPVTASGNEKQLAQRAIAFADRLMKRVYPQRKNVGRYCATCYAFGERFLPGDKQAILGLTRLEVDGVETKLAALLGPLPRGRRPASAPPAETPKAPAPDSVPQPDRATVPRTPVVPEPSTGAFQFQKVFKFDDETEMGKYWEWKSKFTMDEGGAEAPRHPGALLQSRFQLQGDFDVELDFKMGQAQYSNTGGTFVSVCGEGFTVTLNWHSFGAKVRLVRKGDTLQYIRGDTVIEREIKPENRDAPSAVKLKWRSRRCHFREITVAAEKIVGP